MSEPISVQQVREALGAEAAAYTDLELAQIAGTLELLARWALEEELPQRPAGDSPVSKTAA